MNLAYGFTHSGPALNAKELKLLEDELGCAFPDSYKKFMLHVNGGCPDHEVFDNPPEPSFVIQRLFPLGGEKPFELRNMNIHGTDLPKGLLDIGRSLCGDALALCVSGENYGKLYWQDHELAESPDDLEAMHLLCDNFGTFVAALRPLHEIS
ncbi:SMI1/KNR4 family protein [Prosthecobacter sp.]|uniref:SMI1/KNR4 family protein n=1 Tax=Prosthecobacter sp. TaxID=1965333 RepID=UPI002AB9B89E|nr:SMI1/KNR4 family protein [Prosthecobacter sp.]MDZ4405879.1 SMI1/KNR4 family protein [Prosthecobacter sp.]